MKEILLFDHYMIGKPSTTYDVVNPIKCKWVHVSEKYGNPELINQYSDEVTIYTDQCIWMQPKIGKKKIAWLLEPPEYEPRVTNYIKQNYHEFDYVLTWNKELLEIDNRFTLYDTGNSWIKREEIGIYPKNKLISISASWKNFLSGHKIRHQILDRYMKKYKLHWYGRRGLNPQDNYTIPFDPNVQNPVDNLIDAYKDYMFTIVVENANMDYMFSEKLVSPILTGTIPIYYGMPSIHKFFDTRGMIIFNSVDELDGILSELTEQKYYDMFEYSKINFEKAKTYQSIDDGIFDKLVELGVIK